jgi:hypothetical protein
MSRLSSQRGQATILLLAGLCAVLAGAFVAAAVARGIGARSDAQRAADIGALAGARAMHAAYPRLFEPPSANGVANRFHLEKAAYLAMGRAAAVHAARLNGAAAPEVTFPDGDSIAPVRIRVVVRRRVEVERGKASAATTVVARAEAELGPGAQLAGPGAAGGGYGGPLAHRQGRAMRPDVALAFDRLNGAARADGVHLIINSAFRSDAEQAVLWARNPDPKWVAPPGRSLHRYGTELDLGPASAYGWLAANAPAFRFVKRYAWEDWHWGYALNAGSAPPPVSSQASRRPAARHPDGDGHAGGHGSMPAFVPELFAAPIADAAQRWNVAATLLAAQLYAESGFNPFAVSPVGARGIAQFMPATARAYGLGNPFDAAAAIDAQARLMRDLLRRFASVPLALAAYNAGPGRVAACMCVPAIAETRGYVARILGLMGGAGDAPLGGVALAARLVA